MFSALLLVEMKYFPYISFQKSILLEGAYVPNKLLFVNPWKIYKLFEFLYLSSNASEFFSVAIEKDIYFCILEIIPPWLFFFSPVSTFCNENEALSAISSKPESFHVAIVEVMAFNLTHRS